MWRSASAGASKSGGFRKLRTPAEVSVKAPASTPSSVKVYTVCCPSGSVAVKLATLPVAFSFHSMSAAGLISGGSSTPVTVTVTSLLAVRGLDGSPSEATTVML